MQKLTNFVFVSVLSILCRCGKVCPATRCGEVCSLTFLRFIGISSSKIPMALCTLAKYGQDIRYAHFPYRIHDQSS